MIGLLPMQAPPVPKASEDIRLLPIPTPFWQRIARNLLDIVLPPFCPLCSERLQAGEQVVCDACRKKWENIPRPRCPLCGSGAPRPVSSRKCSRCPPSPISFDSARGAFRYAGPAAEIVKALKFHSRVAVAPVMARAMLPMLLEEVVPETGPIDYLAPVPLHFLRRMQRGFNQSSLLAYQLQQFSGIPVLENVLLRVKRTRKQTLLDPAQRHKNVINAFAVNAPGVVAGRRIVLIDDVFTTGATINACALALKNAGAEAVNALCFARA